MLVLFETPAGYAIFKLLNENKLTEIENLYHDFDTPEAACKVVKLMHFEKFADTAEALAATTAAVEGKLCKSLKKVIKRHCSELQEQLAVADVKLGNAIKDKLSLSCVSNTAIQELMRCIRSQMDSLLAGLPKKEMTAMTLGLAHSLSRYKLKFSPDKIDTMVIQAICLLDELDKELNNYVMRCREWYCWHFPELSKIVTDSITFVKTVKIIGTRENAINSDLSDILPEDVEQQIKEAAEISMGTEISRDDVLSIQRLCDEIIETSEYRTQLYDYLKARMMSLSPNLTVLVGELIGARLISRAGSLINLAKHPASTVQILGAEKALFRALKTKKDTPKYGLIYHAQLIGQSSMKNKGKLSRMLAAKASLATRVDALGENENFDLGVKHKVRLEARLKILEERNFHSISGTGKAKAKFEKYHTKSEYIQYPAAADTTLPSAKRKHSEIEKKVLIEEIRNPDEEIVKKKKKKGIDGSPEESVATVLAEEETPTSKKKNKKGIDGNPEESVTKVLAEEETPTSKKKKKRTKTENVEGDNLKHEEEAEGKTIESEPGTSGEQLKKKKRRKEKDEEIEEVTNEETSENITSKKKKKKKKKCDE
ncbi:Nucleolar protein 58 [Melipona bicolor]|uniref:Nucleolar protein 58 n=1 Tax=Melipona bicolor TaxID=60889 RepID=A0AA40KPM6_9HYME|nr:Nucleolar protein 58 [Melipona bicolor]